MGGGHKIQGGREAGSDFSGRLRKGGRLRTGASWMGTAGGGECTHVSWQPPQRAYILLARQSVTSG
jgi:hypothetical protein